MRAMWISAFALLGASTAQAVEPTVGVALTGNLTLGGLEGASKPVEGGFKGGGGLSVPVRLALGQTTDLRLSGNLFYAQGNSTVTGLTHDPETTGCDNVTSRLPSGIFGGTVALGPEIALVKTDSLRLYLLGDAGFGGGTTWMQTFYVTEEVEGDTLAKPGADGCPAYTEPRRSGMMASAQAGMGVGAGPVRFELTYQRLGIPAGSWPTGGEAPGEGVGMVVGSLGFTFGG